MTPATTQARTAREIAIREVAAALDSPSVFMGGPSQQNLRKAEAIFPIIEAAALTVRDEAHQRELRSIELALEVTKATVAELRRAIEAEPDWKQRAIDERRLRVAAEARVLAARRAGREEAATVALAAYTPDGTHFEIAAAIRALPDPVEAEDVREERTCTCGAGHGSLEGHTEWCDYKPDPVEAGAEPAEAWKPTHQHYKGGFYRVIARGRNENTLTPCVIYDNEAGDVWVRPADDFDQTDPFVRFAALPDPM